MLYLQLGEDTLGTRDLNATASLLGSVDDLTVVDHNSVASGALAGSPSNALAEGCPGVRSKDLHRSRQLITFPVLERCVRTCTHNEVIFDVVGLAPGGHDPGVVEGDEDNLVDALGLERIGVLDVGGNMGHLAGRGESTGNGDQDDLLVLELYSQTTPSAACFSISSSSPCLSETQLRTETCGVCYTYPG